ncbi:MAG: plasmid stabilization protein ParE [Citromicrobium sp.]|jgi:toxin ParE1/3/4|nr:plasmid stabilization protein ParE [Citromicrobium sp.]MAO95287.1 plasmid stabilization protein ParE [Citromicrobium sp.]MAS84882.1 plasmid stabilization protein ParE [Erythrobacteraceae bacterium]MBD76462.1 plasmid stabilization protein ParE [Citromicrobium sp.]MBT46934.1 plasmid stabilization protein ParE [Citromicrobium sp.]|tara:strand:- start:408 stop:698 length:291 start_codon:yes stop_codon:yes gene_type:complete
MSGYELSPAAERDLEDIWDYTFETWSREQANSYIGDLIAMFGRIADSPLLGVDVSYLRDGYRKQRCGAHLIFYKIAATHVAIIRILHARRDVEAVL